MQATKEHTRANIHNKQNNILILLNLLILVNVHKKVKFLH